MTGDTTGYSSCVIAFLCKGTRFPGGRCFLTRFLRADKGPRKTEIKRAITFLALSRENPSATRSEQRYTLGLIKNNIVLCSVWNDIKLHYDPDFEMLSLPILTILSFYARWYSEQPWRSCEQLADCLRGGDASCTRQWLCIGDICWGASCKHIIVFVATKMQTTHLKGTRWVSDNAVQR